MFWFKWVVRIILLIFVLAFFHYSLPQRDIVKIVGTEVIRMDVGDRSWIWASKDANTNATTTRDVRFINTEYANGNPMVFRNEDTGWSWPPYLKFDSGNVQSKAQSFAKSDRWVAVRHYGWRNTLFSMYPNATSMEEVTGPDVRLIPWFNIIFLTLLTLAVIAIWVRVARWKDRNIDPVLEDIGDAYDGVTDSVAQQRGRLGRWLDTWRRK